MKALVTGATGFVGGALARRLKGLGWEVTALGRKPRALAELEALKVKAIRADLGDGGAMIQACKGQEIVFHCGALAAPWGKRQDFHNANVAGTENIIRGCEEGRVKRLVYVSTPSIYFGLGSRVNVKEDAPLPEPVSEYARTKLMAEARIDEAFGRGLPVVSIRPRAIFGPGDTTIFPRLIERIKTGRFPVIGDGKNVADLTYIENVVDALLLCADAGQHTLGKKYNISNGEPVVLWDLIEKIAKSLGYHLAGWHVPYGLADFLAGLMEVIYRFIPGRPEPPLTRYSVGIVALSTTLDITAARQELGYTPRISIEEGVEKFIGWWKETQA